MSTRLHIVAPVRDHEIITELLADYPVNSIAVVPGDTLRVTASGWARDPEDDRDADRADALTNRIEDRLQERRPEE